MADEFYRLDLVISTSGDEQTKRKLQAMDRFIEQTRRRGEMLSRMQMSPAIRLVDRISEPLRTIDSKLRGVGSKVWAVTLTAKDKITGTLSNIVKKITSPLALLGAGAGTTAAIAFPLKLAGEFEQARMSLDFYMGSAEKGKKAFEDLITFAAKTPFEFPFLQEMTIQLMGTGYSFEQAKRALTAFGDAAGRTGAGMAGIEDAMIGFTQIASAGTLNLQDLKQVALNLKVPMGIFAKELGVAESELGDIGKRGIPAQKAMEAIVRTLEKKFTGGMKQLSEGLFGLISTIKDTARLTVWSFGAGMAEPVKRILMDIVGSTDYTSDKFKAFQKKVEEVGRSIGEKFERLYQGIKRFFGELAQDEAWKKADWAGKMSILLDQVIKVVAPKAGEVGVKIGTELAKGIISGFGEMISKSPLVAVILGGLAGAGIGSVIPGAGTVVGGVAGGIAGAATWGIGWLLDAIKRQREEFKRSTEIREEQKVYLDFLKNPSKFYFPDNTTIGPAKHALGGIFTRPHLALVAEAGPEAVVPLSTRFRPKALDLWYEAGHRLGIQNFELVTVPAMASSVEGTVRAISLNLGGINIGPISANDLGAVEEKVHEEVREAFRQIIASLQNRS